MQRTRLIPIVLMASVAAWAQSGSTKPASQAAPVATSKTAGAAKTAPKSAMKTAVAAKAMKPTAPTMAKANPMAKPQTVKHASKAAEMPAKPHVAEKPTAAEMMAARAPSKRDPFVSVIVARTGPDPSCQTGKRCLLPEQLNLTGIVKTPSKWIAVVETPAKKTYYLYENDPVYNGVVSKITGDTVVFHISGQDNLGHAVMQDMVKRVQAPAI